MEYKDNVIVVHTRLGKRVLREVEAAFQEVMGPDFVVTLTDNLNARAGLSLHPNANAWDFRHGVHWDPPLMSREEAHRIKDGIVRRLGADFDVVVEATHLHVEFDPKR